MACSSVCWDGIQRLVLPFSFPRRWLEQEEHGVRHEKVPDSSLPAMPFPSLVRLLSEWGKSKSWPSDSTSIGSARRTRMCDVTD